MARNGPTLSTLDPVIGPKLFRLYFVLIGDFDSLVLYSKYSSLFCWSNIFALNRSKNVRKGAHFLLLLFSETIQIILFTLYLYS